MAGNLANDIIKKIGLFLKKLTCCDVFKRRGVSGGNIVARTHEHRSTPSSSRTSVLTLRLVLPVHNGFYVGNPGTDYMLATLEWIICWQPWNGLYVGNPGMDYMLATLCRQCQLQVSCYFTALKH